MSGLKFLYVTNGAVGNAPTVTWYKWQAHTTRDVVNDLFLIIHTTPFVYISVYIGAYPEIKYTMYLQQLL